MPACRLQRFTCGSVALCELGLGSYVFSDRLLARPEEEAKTATTATTAEVGKDTQA